MPVYSYTCLKCSRSIDINLPIEDRNEKQVCRKCKGKLVRGIDKASLNGFDKLGRSKLV